MKYDIVPSSCRVCLQKTKRIRCIYKPGEDGDEAPVEMLKQLTGIDLDDRSDAECVLPKSICKPCELSLNMAFQFRIKALKSQHVLELYYRQYLEKHQSCTIESCPPIYVVKEEFLEINENADQNSFDDESSIKVEKLDSPYLYEDEFDATGKIEYLDELYLEIDDSAHTDEILSTLANTKELSNTPKCDEAQEQHNDAIDTLSPKIVRETINLVPTSPEKSTRQCIITRKADTLSSNTKETAGQLSPPAKKQNKGNKVKPENFICDVCGNIYAKRSRMMEHRRRHNKDLSYACELCDKKFNIREMLRKHMFMHSGGKPYKCSFCSRTFFYESVRKAHEAVHSGHKPYVCDHCNKAFAYSHALNKHKLIHAEIKLYHCQYCNKDFRLQHHMKQHLDTKTHQNAVRIAEEEGKQKTNNLS